VLNHHIPIYNFKTTNIVCCVVSSIYIIYIYFHIFIDFKKVKKDNSLKIVDIDITNNNLSSDTDESSEKCKTILINIL